MDSDSVVTLILLILTVLAIIYIIYIQTKYNKLKNYYDIELINMIQNIDIDDEYYNNLQLIKNALNFHKLKVSEIYTPRIDVVSVNKDATYEEVEKIFKTSSYSRIPVYENTVDNIIGVLNSKDFINNKNKQIDTIMQKPIFTTKLNKISKLLKEFQKTQTHIAIVIDEYGQTMGIITMEDILEELVGEILDEHDERVLDIHQSNNKYYVRGKCDIETLCQSLNIDVKTSSNTVGGWCCEMLQNIPKVNDKFIYNNYKFIIDKMCDKRIDKIIVIPNKNKILQNI